MSLEIFFHICRTDSTLSYIPRYVNCFSKLFVDLEM